MIAWTQKRPKRTTVALFLCLFLAQLMFVGVARAAAASYGLSPASSSTQIDNNLTLTVSVAAGASNITAVQACVQYDASKFTHLSTVAGTALASPTPSDPSTDCNSGEVQLAYYSVSSATGTFTLATLTFKAVAGSGSTTIQFGSKSFIYDDLGMPVGQGVLSLGDSTVGSYSFTSPVAAISNSPSTGTTTTKPKPTTPTATTTPEPTVEVKPATEEATAAETTKKATSTKSVATTTNKPVNKKPFFIAGGSIFAIAAIVGGALTMRHFGYRIALLREIPPKATHISGADGTPTTPQAPPARPPSNDPPTSF